MGWQLAEEILDHAPDMKYREFRVLIAFALEARTETRCGWPGEETLALKANCGVRTVRRAMASLQDKGFLKQLSRATHGRRAVYAIMPLLSPDNMLSGEASDSSPDSMLSGEAGPDRGASPDNGCVLSTPDKNESSPDSVSVLPPVNTPVTIPSVEGSAANSQRPRVHDGPDRVADDREPSLSGADRNQTAGPYARAREGEGPSDGEKLKAQLAKVMERREHAKLQRRPA